jgi:hypothetical protein
MVIEPSGGVRHRLGVWHAQRIARPGADRHIDDTSQKEEGHQGQKKNVQQPRPERVFVRVPGLHEIVEGGHRSFFLLLDLIRVVAAFAAGKNVAHRVVVLSIEFVTACVSARSGSAASLTTV